MLDGKVVRLSRWWTQPILLTVYRKMWRDSTADGSLAANNKSYSYHCTLALNTVGEPVRTEHEYGAAIYRHGIEATVNDVNFQTTYDATEIEGDATPVEIFV
jgi:hypothetical protein